MCQTVCVIGQVLVFFFFNDLQTSCISHVFHACMQSLVRYGRPTMHAPTVHSAPVVRLVSDDPIHTYTLPPSVLSLVFSDRESPSMRRGQPSATHVYMDCSFCLSEREVSFRREACTLYALRPREIGCCSWIDRGRPHNASPSDMCLMRRSSRGYALTRAELVMRRNSLAINQ